MSGGWGGLRLREQQRRTKRMHSKWNYWLKSYCHLVSAKMPTGAVPGADRAHETGLTMSPGGRVGSRNIVCTWTKKKVGCKHSEGAAAVPLKAKELRVYEKKKKQTCWMSLIAQMKASPFARGIPSTLRQPGPCRLRLIDCRTNLSLVQRNCWSITYPAASGKPTATCKWRSQREVLPPCGKTRIEWVGQLRETLFGCNVSTVRTAVCRSFFWNSNVF